MNWSFQYPRPLEGSVVRRHYESVGFNTMLTLWRRRWMIVFLMILGASMAIVTLKNTDKRYTSTALVQIDFGHQQRVEAGTQAAPLTLDPSSLIETEARFLRSRTVARQVAEQLARSRQASDIGSSPPREASFVAESDVQKLMRNLVIRNDSRSYLIDVAYTANDPVQAAQIANLFAKTYIEDRTEASFEAARRASEWYAAQIRDTNAALISAERAASDYRTSFGIVETAVEGSTLQQQKIRELQTQASQATLTRINLEARLARDRLAVDNGDIPSDIATLPDIQRLIESREAARRKVSELSATVGDLHPSAVGAKALLQEAEQRLRRQASEAIGTIADDAANARKVESQLLASADQARGALIDGKTRESDLLTLQGQADAIRDRLKTLNENFEQARALSELKPVAAQIMSPADVIAIPTGPKASVVLGIALLAAGGFGVAVSLLLERRDTGFRREEEVFPDTDCRCFGLMSTQSRREKAHEAAARREAIRAIAASAGLMSSQSGARVVLVTSALPREGKSALVEALARCMVDLGRNVLILDASPRSERRADDAPSLEDKVAGTARRRRRVEGEPLVDGTVIQRWTAPHHNVRPLPDSDHGASLSVLRRRSGLAESGMVFANSAIEELISEARLQFDVVIIKAPPVLLVADSLLLAQVADTVIQAVRWHATEKAMVGAALKRLRDAAVHVSGIVLTQVNMDQYSTYRTFFGKSSVRKYRKYYAAFD